MLGLPFLGLCLAGLLCFTGHGADPDDVSIRGNARIGGNVPGRICAIGSARDGGNVMTIITCIEDLRQVARRRVPRQFFEYAEAGSYSEQTLRANRSGGPASKVGLRILAEVSPGSTATTILGEPASLPLILAPIGACGMQHGDGEILACRAAQAAGIPFARSAVSVCSIEDVAAAV